MNSGEKKLTYGKEKKMKTKKIGIAGLLAVMVITTLLVLNCVEPVSTSGLGGYLQKDDHKPAAGMAYFRLNIADQNGRTLLPDAIVGGISAFIKFDLLVYEDTDDSGTLDLDGTDDPVTIPSLSAGANLGVALGTINGQAIELPAGEYFFRVVAYRTSGSTTYAAAGNSTLTELVVNQGNPVNIILRDVGVSTGNGIFAWNFTNPAGTTLTSSPEFSLARIGGGSSYLNQAFTSGTAGTLAVASGYYHLTIPMTAAGHAPYTYYNVVHIYQDRITTATLTLPDLAVNEYTVKFYYDDGRAGSPFSVVEVPHGTTLGDLLLGDGSDHASPDYGDTGSGALLSGWYRGSHTGTEKFNDNDPIIGPTDLYSKWATPTAFTLSITYTPDTPGTSPAVTDDASGTIAQGDVIEFSITNAATYNSFQWYVDGIEASGETSSTFEWDTANIVAKTYSITVTAMVGIVPYSTTAEVVVSLAP